MTLSLSQETYTQALQVQQAQIKALQEKVIELHSNPEGRFYGYVCTTSFFTKITGPPVLNKHFSRDGIHLNEFGASVLALNLLSEANTLARTVVDYFPNRRSA